MIQSFGDRATEALFHGRRYRGPLPQQLHPGALRKLDMINAAQQLGDLRSPPGNRLESLRGNLNGYHSIRINQQWRIIFSWQQPDAHDVQIVDYH